MLKFQNNLSVLQAETLIYNVAWSDSNVGKNFNVYYGKKLADIENGSL